MKNTFSLEVSFSKSPVKSYEWKESVFMTHLKLERVSTAFLKNVLEYEAKIDYKNPTILLSDTKEAVVLRLDKNGHVQARSFLKFSDAIDVCEHACNMKESKIAYSVQPKKIKYDRGLSIEKEMKDYILDRVKKNEDVYFSKYLYYLYSGDINGFSEDKLIKTIKTAPLDKNMKLYKLLIES